jgi:hypothetical protein
MNIKKITLSALAWFCAITTSFAQDMESKASTSKFFFDANYGYTIRTAKTADGLGQVENDMIKKIKQGGNLYLEAGYKINNRSSIGLVYNRFGFKGEIDNVTIVFNGVGERSGTWTNKGNISFIGPKYNYQGITPNQKGELMTGLGLGFLSYQEENSINSSTLSENKGGTIGILATASYYHFIGKNIAIGSRIGLISGTLSKIKTTVNGKTTETNLDDNEKESLGQFNINAGLRVYF